MEHTADKLLLAKWNREADQRFSRKMAIRREIGNVSLGSFKAEDLYPLVKIYMVGEGLSDSELSQLEGRLAEIRRNTEQA